jgi:hypothetical protein
MLDIRIFFDAMQYFIFYTYRTTGLLHLLYLHLILNFAVISDLRFLVSEFQHHKKLFSKT